MHIMIKFPDLQVWEYILTTFLTTKYEQDKRVFFKEVTVANSPNNNKNFFMVLNLKTERILVESQTVNLWVI